MKKINVGIIGTGKIAQVYVDIFKKLKINVKIICARNKKKLENFCKINKIKQNTLNINDLLHEDIDGIVSCVSPTSSFNVARKLSSFKRINFIRKASWLNYIQTLKIKSLYKNKNLFVALNRRYLSAVVKSKKLLIKLMKLNFLVSTIRKIQLKQKKWTQKRYNQKLDVC